MFSNEKLPQKLYYPTEIVLCFKQAVIYAYKPLPIGFTAPMLRDELLKLQFPHLRTAMDHLLSEIEILENYFRQNNGVKPIHATMGELDKNEWDIFNNQHVHHHFK